jgi:hypothetical protein
MMSSNQGNVTIEHRDLGEYALYADETDIHLFCDNETNIPRLYGGEKSGYFKDGVQEFLLHGHQQAINYEQGTKVVLNYDKTIAGGESVTVKLRLSDSVEGNAFGILTVSFRTGSGRRMNFMPISSMT